MLSNVLRKHIKGRKGKYTIVNNSEKWAGVQRCMAANQ